MSEVATIADTPLSSGEVSVPTVANYGEATFYGEALYDDKIDGRLAQPRLRDDSVVPSRDEVNLLLMAPASRE